MTCSGTKFRFGKIQRNIWRWDELVPKARETKLLRDVNDRKISRKTWGESTVYSLREQHDSVFLEFVHARFLFEKPAVQLPVRELL